VAKESVITDERVEAAAEKLKAEGRRVSVRNVRGELGEGSYATINPLLKKVKGKWALAAEMAAKMAEGNFPSDLATAYHKNLEREKGAVREHLRSEIEDLHVQVDEAETAFTEAKARGDELEEQIVAEREEAAKKIRDLEIAVAGKTERNAAIMDSLQTVRIEREELLKEKDKAVRECTGIQLELKRADQAQLDLQRRADQLEARNQMLQKEIAESKERAAVAEQHARDMDASYAALREQCESLRGDLKETQGEHKTMTARLLEVQTALVEAQERHSSAEARQAEAGGANEVAAEKSKTPDLSPGRSQNKGRKTKSAEAKETS